MQTDNTHTHTCQVSGLDAVLAADIRDATLLGGGTLQVVEAGGTTPHFLLLPAHAHYTASTFHGTLAGFFQLLHGSTTNAIVTPWGRGSYILFIGRKTNLQLYGRGESGQFSHETG